jgi:hypothetical protein
VSETPADIDINKAIVHADPDYGLAENAVDNSTTTAEAAVALFVFGANYTEIKNKLGYSSAHRAKRAVERALAASADSEDDRDKARTVIRKQLRRLLAAHMPQAVDPKNPNQLPYSARTLAIIDRLSKLDGADAPTQIQVSASDQLIEEMVMALSPTAQSDLEQVEYDITQADEIEDAVIVGDDGEPEA